MKTVAIPLLGKGATNHLHKVELVDEFKKQDMRILFLVRDDFADLIERIPGCDYMPYTVPELSGWRKTLVDLCCNLRYSYPSYDVWRRWRYKILRTDTPRFMGRLYLDLLNFLARFQSFMRIIIRIEAAIWNSRGCPELDKLNIDCLLMIGVGTWFDNRGAAIHWWAVKKQLPFINFIGNYDGLSSKGYRGYHVSKVLVWGPRMREDAENLHGIPHDRVREVGPMRYSNLLSSVKPISREDFLKSRGLDPEAITVTFAGPIHDFHYFEMLAVFEQLKARSARKMQLIFRVYPNQHLLNTPYMDVFLKHVKTLPDVWVSLANPKRDPKKKGFGEPIKIEENDLWNILKFSNAVVNVFSTVTIETCIFDTPVINMWYFPKVRRAVRQPVYRAYPLVLHIRRVIESGAAEVATSRDQLVELIEAALKDPARQKEQRRQLVYNECGVLDSKSAERIAKEVREEIDHCRPG